MRSDFNNIKKKYKEYIENIYESYINKIENDLINLNIKGIEIYINFKENSWHIKDFEKNNGHCDNNKCFNLTSEERLIVLITCLMLFKIGYSLNDIYLEKMIPLGVSPNSGYIDIMVMKKNKSFYILEAKTPNEIQNYINLSDKTHTLQLFTYLWQFKETKIGSYFTFDINKKTFDFYNILNADIVEKASSSEDLYDVWLIDKAGAWDQSSIIINEHKYGDKFELIQMEHLKELSEKSVKNLFTEFLTALRLNSVTDKASAFDKLINLFIAKVQDENSENKVFEINNQKYLGLEFQWVEGLDDNITFIKRISKLYSRGMENFLNVTINEITEDKILKIAETKDPKQINELINNLRFKQDNPFNFIEVYDDDTFEKNILILKKIVSILEYFKFKYNNKYQYIGDFFEELLNNSWKQEAGQFFTPMPLVEFMIDSLPVDEEIWRNCENSNLNIIPRMIDFAAGSGHFLIYYMDKAQKFLKKINEDSDFSAKVKKQIQSYVINPFSWAKESVFGIEKDYRLAKTIKISTFLNGDGEATIVNGDALDKLTNKDYWKIKDIIGSTQKQEWFDFVISNPPYSIRDFKKNLIKNGITKDDFIFYEELDKNENAKSIEILFVERLKHLLKTGGYAAIILPYSFLNANQYSSIRKFLLTNFKIMCIFESGDITFSKTTTSTVILFLQKSDNGNIKNINKILNYETMVIFSPRMLFNTVEEEKNFLGYTFSNSKFKKGIKILNNNLKINYSPVIKQFILGSTNINIKNLQNIKIKKINDIVIFDNKKYEIYPLRNKIESLEKWISLDKIIKEDIEYKKDNEELYLLKIGNIKDNKINIDASTKKVKDGKICEKNDILFPLVSPKPSKIAIANDKYYVSSAILVIKIEDEKIRDNLFKYLKNNENNVFNEIYAYLKGFKISYGRFDTTKLQYIYLEKSKIYQ